MRSSKLNYDLSVLLVGRPLPVTLCLRKTPGSDGPVRDAHALAFCARTDAAMLHLNFAGPLAQLEKLRAIWKNGARMWNSWLIQKVARRAGVSSKDLRKFRELERSIIEKAIVIQVSAKQDLQGADAKGIESRDGYFIRPITLNSRRQVNSSEPHRL